MTWLSGITVEERIALIDGYVLRPLRADDLTMEMLADLSSSVPTYVIPDAILEIKRRSKEEPSSHDARRIVNSLCLFSLGSVQILNEQTTSNSLLNSGGKLYPSVALHPHFRYHITRQDRGRLRRFVAVVAPLLPVKPTGTHSENRWVGLKQYFRALHDANDAEERTALGVAALEGILTVDKEGEYAHKLALRTASLLRFTGLNPLAVFRSMKRAYDVRSKYAHGSLIKPKDREAAKELYRSVLEYARLALVKFLESTPWQNKKGDFLKELDESLLDESTRKKLRRELAGGLCKI